MKKHVFLLSGLLSVGLIWSARAQTNLTDPQIAMIAVTANSIDIKDPDGFRLQLGGKDQ